MSGNSPERGVDEHAPQIRRVSRRALLQRAVLLAGTATIGAGLLEACSSAPAAPPPATAAPAGAPTSAPAISTVAPAAKPTQPAPAQPTVAPTSAPAPTAAPAAAATPTTAAPAVTTASTGTVTGWLHPIMSDRPTETQYWSDLTAAFQKENPGATVDITWVPWDGGYQKKAVAIQTGQVPDFTFAGAEQVVTFASMGAVLPLDDLVQQLGGPSVFIDQMKWLNWNGHLWGIPGQEGGYLFYGRKDILQKAGITALPKTWDELNAAAQKVNDPNNNVFALGLDYSSGNTCRQMYESFGATANSTELNSDGKVAVDTPGNLKLLTFFTDFALKGLVPPGATAINQFMVTGTPIDDWFASGLVAMAMRPADNATLWAKTQPDLWAQTLVGTIPAGETGHTGTFAQPGGLYIFKDGKNVDLAKKFLTYFARPDNMKKFSEVSTYPLYGNVDYSYSNLEWYKDLKEELQYGVRTGYHQVNPQNGAAEESFWPAKMVQDVVINKMTPQDALTKWQKEVEKIYASA